MIVGYSEKDEITVKDYFKGETRPEVLVGGEELDFTAAGDDSLFVASNSSKITGTEYNEEIYAGQKTKTIAAGDGNNYIEQYYDPENSSKNKQHGQVLSITAGKDSDTYILNDLERTVDITDKGGADILNINSDVQFVLEPGEEPIIGNDYLTAIFDVLSDKEDAKAGKKADFNKLQFVRVNTDETTGELWDRHRTDFLEVINQRDIIFITGGGNAGYLWRYAWLAARFAGTY